MCNYRGAFIYSDTYIILVEPRELPYEELMQSLNELQNKLFSDIEFSYVVAAGWLEKIIEA